MNSNIALIISLILTALLCNKAMSNPVPGPDPKSADVGSRRNSLPSVNPLDVKELDLDTSLSTGGIQKAATSNSEQDLDTSATFGLLGLGGLYGGWNGLYGGYGLYGGWGGRYNYYNPYSYYNWNYPYYNRYRWSAW